MKKLSFLIILSILLTFMPASTVHANGEWVPNPYGLAVVPNAYHYSGAWWTAPPTTPGAIYEYNGQTYTVGGSTSTPAQPAQPAQPTQPTYWQPAQTVCQQPTQPQTVRPYWYDNAWHTNMPSEGSKSYWYNGAWYTTPASWSPAPAPAPTQRPSAQVDNMANSKSQELVNYAISNGVAGSYEDSTDSSTVAQKHISFSGLHGSFDMTLTTHIGSDGNYVTKYWRAGIERSLGDIQGMILGCR